MSNTIFQSRSILADYIILIVSAYFVNLSLYDLTFTVPPPIPHDKLQLGTEIPI